MLNLILKTSSACNLRCSYCSVGKKDNSTLMNLEMMKKSARWFIDYAKTKGEKELSIIFHGGEPCLINPNVYQSCIEYINEISDGLEIKYDMQTNGTILNDAWIKLWQKNHIKIGISLDGDKRTHNLQRKDANSNETYDVVIDNIKRMKSSGIKVATLMVVTKNSLEMDLSFLKLLDDMSIPIKINPLLAEGEALEHESLFLENGEYADFIIRVFNYLIDERIMLAVSPINDIFSAIIDERVVHGCTFYGDCSQRFICITNEGNIYPCGRFADEKQCLLGNIETSTDINHDVCKLLKERRTILPSECQKCDYRKLCHAGCSAGMIKSEGIYIKTTLCEDYKKIFGYLYSEGLNKYSDYLIKRKKEILQKLQEDSKDGL